MFPRNLKLLNNKSYFLLGPRGTGKSTWLKALFPQAPVLDLLHEGTFQEMTRSPSLLEGWIEARKSQTKEGPIIIDEIQRVPALLNEVHRLIEDHRLCFILTGSSARKLRRESANLLAGRALLKHMHPLTASELGASFDIQHSLRHGQLPTVYASDHAADYLKSYIGIYLREEIQQEALVRRLDVFARFLESASFSQASVLSVAKVAQDCGVERKTAESYFQLLEDLLIAIRIPVFTRRAKRRLTTHPKFYYFDAGVFRTLRPRGPLDSEEEIQGAAIETLVMQDLRAYISNNDLALDLFFWRSAKKEEVDFVLYGEAGFFALEVKRSSRWRPEDLEPLKEFIKDYPEARAYLLYGGTERYVIDGISIVPLTDAIKDWGALIKK